MSDPHYDAVIVGSGFGGAVMAYRLAEAGLSVCVLERGKAYPPGSFPRAPVHMKDNVWDPGEGKHGLFDLWSFSGLDAVVASGLGGGSLIYANVLLRKDEHWFVKEDLRDGGYECWPVTRGDLDPHYDAVERALRPAPYPTEHAPYDATPKTRALQAAAKALGREWFRPPLAIAFASGDGPPIPGAPLSDPPGDNRFGVPRTTCRLCAECVLGCNYGAKQTLDLTYLSRAEKLGAELRTGREVRWLQRDDRGYRIGYVDHGIGDDDGGGFGRRGDATPGDGLPIRYVTASFAVLAAGTLGTTRLLLQMREAGALPGLGDALGSRFSGNGDLLAFALRCREAGDDGLRERRIDATFGPTITSAIRIADRADGGNGRGHYVQDAGFPDFVAWITEILGGGTSGLYRGLRLVKRYLAGALHLTRDTNLSAELADLLGDASLSGDVLPLLLMGRDVPNGRISLRGRNLEVDWRLHDSEGYVEEVRATARDIARVLHADYHDNPIFALRRLVTVHPLGGAPMGRVAAEGVVDAHGQVFGHDGLYVADGSVMPGPVGANPALTIAALADRFADHLIDARRRRNTF